MPGGDATTAAPQPCSSFPDGRDRSAHRETAVLGSQRIGSALVQTVDGGSGGTASGVHVVRGIFGEIPLRIIMVRGVLVQCLRHGGSFFAGPIGRFLFGQDSAPLL
jgi:hypothetical protein